MKSASRWSCALPHAKTFLRTLASRPLNKIGAATGAKTEEYETAEQEGLGDQDLFAAAASGTAERKDVRAWYKQMREKLSKNEFGPMFLGGSYPFPYNTEFKPQPPLANNVKDQIFSTWRSDASKWTPRQLSLRYKISIERVKAVIRMKSLQAKMVSEGFLVNSKYVQAIESILGCSKATTFSEHAQALQVDLTRNMAPKLVAVPKDETFTSMDAALVLGRRLAPIHAAIREEVDSNRPFDPNPDYTIKITDKERQSLYIKKDPYEASRWQFVFTDTSMGSSSPKEDEFLIREKDGTLRWAHVTERAREIRLRQGARAAKTP